jgi:hypothetical protein
VARFWCNVADKELKMKNNVVSLEKYYGMFKDLVDFKELILLNHKDDYFILVEAIHERVQLKGWVNNNDKYSFSFDIKAINQSCDELIQSVMVVLNKSIIKNTKIEVEEVESEELGDDYFSITMLFNNKKSPN